VKDKIQVIILTTLLILNVSVLAVLLTPEREVIEERQSIEVEECNGNTYADDLLIITPDKIIFYHSTGEPRDTDSNGTYSVSYSICYHYDVYWDVLNITEIEKRLT
jgi:uncharacterized membrane protein